MWRGQNAPLIKLDPFSYYACCHIATCYNYKACNHDWNLILLEKGACFSELVSVGIVFVKKSCKVSMF